MSKNKILQPKIRFKEFSGENAEAWEQRKFKEFTLRLTETAGSSSNSPSVEYEDLISNIGKLNKDVRLKDNNKVGVKFESGDVLFGKLRPYLKKWLLADFKGVAVGDFWVLRPLNTDSHFLFYLIQTKKFEEVSNISTGTKMPRSDWNLVSNTLFPITKINEQKSIGNLLLKLDTTITLHQRKLKTLESLKKTLLSKMFPKNGKAVPELRFSGFTDNWEQRKLGEITSITMGQSPNSVNYTNNPNDHILVQGNADILNGKVNPRVWTKEVTKTAEPGDIILTVRAPVGDVAVTEYNVVLGRGVASIKGNGFIFQLLKTFKLNGYWLKLSTGSTFDSINSLDLKNTTAYIPNKTEQDAISFLLSIVDTTITLHQRKIEQYQELKKTLLSKMFI